MKKLKILVDSGSDISKEECEKYDITMVPLNLQIEGRTVSDSHEFDAEKYCDYLKVAPDVPKTAQPSPQAFLDYYREFSEDYEHIIVITMSSKASGTYQSAMLAKDLFEEENESCHVHVVDSTSTSFAISILAIHAATLLEKGESIQKILAQLVEDGLRVGTYYLVDDISFLVKGGRISSLTGGILTKMNIKPIICAKNGVAHNHSAALGFQNGIGRMVNIFKNNAKIATPLFICHAHCMEKAEALAAAIQTVVPEIRIRISQMHGTMCTHAGPNTVGMFFFQKQYT